MNAKRKNAPLCKEKADFVARIHHINFHAIINNSVRKKRGRERERERETHTHTHTHTQKYRQVEGQPLRVKIVEKASGGLK